MSDALGTYLQDHLAGAAVAVQLLETLRDDHPNEPLGRFAGELLVEIEADRAVLRALAERIGAATSPLKDATAWLTEKLARLKLGRSVAGALGTYEALETLALGILGKLALWEALAVVLPTQPRLHGIDLDRLIARAKQQHAHVEAQRLSAARIALS
jgi:hypothetical protein